MHTHTHTERNDNIKDFLRISVNNACFCIKNGMEVYILFLDYFREIKMRKESFM